MQTHPESDECALYVSVLSLSASAVWGVWDGEDWVSCEGRTGRGVGMGVWIWGGLKGELSMRKGVGRDVEGESGNVIDACLYGFGRGGMAGGLCGFGRDGSMRMVI